MKQFNKNNKSLVKTDLLSSIISRRKKDTIVQLIDGEIYNTKKAKFVAASTIDADVGFNQQLFRKANGDWFILWEKINFVTGNTFYIEPICEDEAKEYLGVLPF